MNSGKKRSAKSGTEIEMRQILKQKTNLIFDKVKPTQNAENVPKTARFKQLSIQIQKKGDLESLEPSTRLTTIHNTNSPSKKMPEVLS